ncbi:MAG: DUF2339 domain-containing protein [Pseudomonadota bacterium]
MPLLLLVPSNRMSEQLGQLEVQLKQMKQEARPDGTPTPASEAPPELPDASKPPPPDTMPKEVSAQTRSHEIAAESATPDNNEVEPKRQRYVFTQQNGAQLYDWLAEHWVSVVAMLSLTFASIFSIRYGIEHGLLPPALRVACRGGLGVALIFAG